MESCTCGYEGENEFEVTDRFGHQIFLAEEDSACCFRQCCESLRGFKMNLTDRQVKIEYELKTMKTSKSAKKIVGQNCYSD